MFSFWRFIISFFCEKWLFTFEFYRITAIHSMASAIISIQRILTKSNNFVIFCILSSISLNLMLDPVVQYSQCVCGVCATIPKNSFIIINSVWNSFLHIQFVSYLWVQWRKTLNGLNASECHFINRNEENHNLLTFRNIVWIHCKSFLDETNPLVCFSICFDTISGKRSVY